MAADYASSTQSSRRRGKQPKFIIVNPPPGHHGYAQPMPYAAYPYYQQPLQCTCRTSISPVHCPECRPGARRRQAPDLDRCLDNGLKCLGAPFGLLGSICESTWQGLVRGCSVVGAGIDACYDSGVNACTKACDAMAFGCEAGLQQCSGAVDRGFRQCTARIEDCSRDCEKRADDLARKIPRPQPTQYHDPSYHHHHHGCPVHDPHSRCRTCGRNIVVPVR